MKVILSVPDEGFLSVPDEGFSRNASCTLHLISTFYYGRKKKDKNTIVYKILHKKLDLLAQTTTRDEQFLLH